MSAQRFFGDGPCAKCGAQVEKLEEADLEGDELADFNEGYTVTRCPNGHTEVF